MLIVGGGQSGLSAARAGRDRGWEPVVLEAGPEPVGSWPAYYESLRLFSPRRYSGFPAYPFPGPPDDCPHRDEVVDYLAGYSAWLGVDIHTSARVASIAADDGGGFTAILADGGSVAGDAVIAASGSFQNPFVPQIPGSQEFAGRVLHVAGPDPGRLPAAGDPEPDQYWHPGHRHGHLQGRLGDRAAGAAQHVHHIHRRRRRLAGRGTGTGGCGDLRDRIPPSPALPRLPRSCRRGRHTEAPARESRPRTRGSGSWGWSSSGRSPRTRCAVCTATLGWS